ncbi:MAG: fibronectin type III domain-containing protein, partial [Pirellula staleyi]
MQVNILNSLAKQISERSRSRVSARQKKARAQLRLETLEPRLMLVLLHQADFSYLGAFRVPQGAIGPSSFAYGGTAPAYNATNHSLFLVGHDYDQAIAEISIPQIVNSSRLSDLRTASVLQSFSPVQSRMPEWTLDSPAKIGGLQVVGSQLVGSFFEYYDGNYSAVDSHFKLSSLNLASGTYRGLDQVGNMGGGFVGGYMTAVPPEWQAALGAPYLTGQAALSIIGRTSAGPAAFGFNPADLGSTTAPTVDYVNYPLTHPLRPETTTNPWFNLTTEINGVVFPPNSDSVIFIGSHGTGTYCYGEAAACNDPVRLSKGPHSVGGLYAYQAWAYNANDFVDVKNGLKQPWEIQPYDVWTFDLPFPEASKHIGGVSFDAATGRLYVSQKSADQVGYDPYPVINVFQLPSAQVGPTLSNVRSSGITQNSATILWDSNVPATSRVEFGTTASFGSFSPLDSTLVTSHSVSLNGLLPDTIYSYRVLSRNAAGIETVSSTATFRTTANVPVPNGGLYSYANPKPLAPFDSANTTTVTNVSQLINAVNSLTSGKTIAIASGVYDLNGVADALYIPQGISNWAIRGATGNRNDVVIRGGGMTGSVRFGFWVGGSVSGTIADLTIDGVQQHGIIANPGAHDMLYHGLRIVDSGYQFIKSNPVGLGVGNDRGIVEYSIFEYRSTDNNTYSNGVDVHGGDDWIVRYNLFKNFL